MTGHRLCALTVSFSEALMFGFTFALYKMLLLEGPFDFKLLGMDIVLKKKQEKMR